MRQDFDRRWAELSGDALIGIKEWRMQHPHATLKEIEVAIDERLARLRARRVEDAALASAAAEWEEEAEEEQPCCPRCGEKMKRYGTRRERHLQTHGGQEIRLERGYGVCPACGAEFFPLDEELGLLAGSASRYLQEQMTRLSTWIPSFGHAAELLEVFTGARVWASGMRRHSEEAGAMYVQLQEQEVERLKHERVEELQGPEQLVMSADGAMVPVVGGEWKECKTLVVGEPCVRQGAQGERVVQSEHLSDYSRTMEADRFKWQALVETHRRGVATAKRVASVSDGSEWIQGFVDFHRPDAVRILDMPHVGEYVNQTAQAVYGEGTPRAQNWWHTQMQQLKERGPGPLLGELRALCAAHPQDSLLSDNLAYLQKREGQMHYPAYQAAGWPLGSGMVESANKLLVEDRLKGSGMHWAPQHVNPMLALRTIVFNDRWDEAWPQIALALRQHTRQRRFEDQHKRRAAHLPPNEQVLPLQRVPCGHDHPAPTQRTLPVVVPVPPMPHRPAPNHPWRHSPIGKARYQPCKPYDIPKS